MKQAADTFTHDLFDGASKASGKVVRSYQKRRQQASNDSQRLKTEVEIHGSKPSRQRPCHQKSE